MDEDVQTVARKFLDKPSYTIVLTDQKTAEFIHKFAEQYNAGAGASD